MQIDIGGVSLFFDVDGEGWAPDGLAMRQKPTIVLSHGGPGADHSVHKPFFSQLTDIAQIVYYDHRGNGRSDLSDQSCWNLDQWGEDLKSLCDALGIIKPIVIGTSFGGFVALSYATKYPDHLAGLGLISTAAKVDFAKVYQAFERIGGAGARDIAERYWENPTDIGRAEYRERCVPLYSATKQSPSEMMSRIIWRNETALWFNGPHNEHGRFDFCSKLNRIHCPTLVMVGEDDPITPPEFSDAIVAGLAAEQIAYHKFMQCGHGVVGDKPVEALSALRRFVTGLS